MSWETELAALMARYDKSYICITLDHCNEGYNCEITSNVDEYHISPILQSMTVQLDKRIYHGTFETTPIVRRDGKARSKLDGRIRRGLCPVYNLFEKKP